MDIQAKFLARHDLASLLERLGEQGYTCIGPRVRDNAVVFDELNSIDELPRGVLDDQQPGSYRLRQTDLPFFFAFTTCAQGIKPFLFAPHEPLWTSTGDGQEGMVFEPSLPQFRPLAIIGARACDISAMHIQDRHFAAPAHSDPHYTRRRADLFVVAVQCMRSTDTCFCSSTGDGPHVAQGYDLRLMEVEDGFIVQGGSEAGERLMAQLPLRPASTGQLAEGERRTAQAAVQQRALPSANLEDALFARLDHPRWEQVAQRCLSCANCTSVCPTCFCYRAVDDSELGAAHTIHARTWDSCFTRPHSYIRGITIRAETPQRYRQWLTHKLGSWHSQYGRSGCTGCGRCITWCPTGIDITEEANVICADNG